MYQFHINDMVNRLEKAKIISPSQRKETYTAINDYWKDRIAISWCTDDVIETAKQDKIRISNTEARKILQIILNNNDAEYGVTYEADYIHFTEKKGKSKK